MELKKAEIKDMDAFCEIIDRRIHWMDDVGLKQWNYTGYWDRYPREYYRKNIEQGRAIVLAEGERLLAVGVIYEEDVRWVNSGDLPAYYLHHFATDVDEPGIGAVYLEQLEDYSRRMGKCRLRLDCAVDNPRLNRYYEEKGYTICGSCKDGLYEGITREKKL